MQTALEVSFYILAGIFTLGFLMVLLLVKDVFFHGRFTKVLPPIQRVPTTALDETRLVLKRLKAVYVRVHGERQNEIGIELRHLEHRLSSLEDKTYVDQAEYYDAVKAREKVWREWRGLHDEIRRTPRGKRKPLLPRLDELKAKYLIIDREVNEEWHRAGARDVLTLEELKVQGVLEPEVLVKPVTPPGAPAGSNAGAAGESQEGEAKDQQKDAVRTSKWPNPLTPYPPAAGGELRQGDMALPEVQKTERTYVEATLSLSGLPNGMLVHADMSLSSFAEVEMVGIHRYLGCTFIGTDFRRIEVKQGGGVHLFQDCNFKGSSLAQSWLSGVIFRRCDLSNTHWKGARMDRVKFENCQLENVHWEGVDLSRAMVTEELLPEGMSKADYSSAGKPPRNLMPEAAPEEGTGRAESTGEPRASSPEPAAPEPAAPDLAPAEPSFPEKQIPPDEKEGQDSSAAPSVSAAKE